MGVAEKLSAAMLNGEAERVEQASEAALEVVNFDLQREQLVVTERDDRDRRIAESYEIAGRVQALEFARKVLTAGTLMQLMKIKKSKAYKDLPGIGTWSKYCEYLGLSRQKIDEDLLNLEAFGEEFIANVSNFDLGYRDLRKLRRLNSEGVLQISDNEVVIGDEHIPLTPDSKEELEIALERLIDAKEEVIREKDATIRTNEKLLAAKEDLIKRQAKDLAKLEKEEEAKGPDAWEADFVQKMRNARVTIDGYLNQFDPSINPLPEGYTPRMANEMMITLQSLLRSIKASYDTAADIYGDPDLDDQSGWVPPHLRAAGDGE